MIGPLFKRNMVVSWKPLAAFLAIIGMYTTVIIYMYNPEFSNLLLGYQKIMPAVMSLMGMTGVAGNLTQWIQMFLYGFIMNIFPMIFAVIVVNNLLASYIERGSMANLLSSPHSRGEIIATQAASAILLMAILIGMSSGLGILISQILFPGQLDVGTYLLLNLGALLMQLLIMGIVFAAACVFSESKYFFTVGAGIPLLFFVISMMANMGGKMKHLKYATVYTLFPAAEIVQGKEGFWKPELVMALIIAVLFGGGVWWFRKRDLSL